MLGSCVTSGFQRLAFVRLEFADSSRSELDLFSYSRVYIVIQ